MSDESLRFLCAVKRTDIERSLKTFYQQFDLKAEWIDDLGILQRTLEQEEEMTLFDGVFIDEALSTVESIRTVQLMRYLPHTRSTYVLVVNEPGSAVLPFYQTGATLCLESPLSTDDLMRALDCLFG